MHISYITGVYSGFMILPEKYDFSNSPILIITHGFYKNKKRRPTYTFDNRIRQNDKSFIGERNSNIFRCFIYIKTVNYRGSLGFDEKSLSSLYGKIGKQDVEDVHVDRFLNSSPFYL